MIKLKDITTYLAAFLISSGFAFASGTDLNDEELVTRQVERVGQAAPDDWKTLADCANTLVSRRIVTNEAKRWIDRSISIRETVYNRTVLGDYLVLKGNIKKGQAEYVRAIELARLENNTAEVSNIQWKILISMGMENYNKFQAENR